MLDDIVAHDIAQGIGIPIPATKDSLLPPWTRIASCLRPHPAGLALLITEQTFQKQACVPRNPFPPEQWTYPLLKLLERRSPQRKRLFHRRCLRPRSSNHGCPWIQKSSERATVMLDHDPIDLSDHDLILLFEHDLRANASRLSRGKTGSHFSGSCSRYFQGVTGGTLSVAGGTSTVLKSAGLTISRYSMSGE